MSKSNAKSASSATPVILAVDVSRDRLNLFTRIAGREHELEFANRTDVIETELRALAARARAAGAKEVLVVAESTGRYHCSLLRVAGQLGLQTAWVSAEAVAKMRVVETNDTGKTDRKDPRVIYSLASLGKTLRHRELDEPYSLRPPRKHQETRHAVSGVGTSKKLGDSWLPKETCELFIGALETLVGKEDTNRKQDCLQRQQNDGAGYALLCCFRCEHAEQPTDDHEPSHKSDQHGPTT